MLPDSPAAGGAKYLSACCSVAAYADRKPNSTWAGLFCAEMPAGEPRRGAARRLPGYIPDFIMLIFWAFM
jgi:hypothetical protein